MKKLALDINMMNDILASITDDSVGMELMRAIYAFAAGEEPEVSERAAKVWARVRPIVERELAGFERRSKTNTKNACKRYESQADCMQTVCESHANGSLPLPPTPPNTLPNTNSITDIYNPPHSSSVAPQGAERKQRTIFKKPTLNEAKAYASTEGLQMDVDSFYDYFESVGWRVSGGRASMKDWKAAMRGWARRERQFQQAKSPPRRQEPRSSQYRNADLEALEVKL